MTVYMTTKVLALSTVAHTLGTDLTSLRAAGRRLFWCACTGGEHRVREVDTSRAWSVDLVTGMVRVLS